MGLNRFTTLRKRVLAIAFAALLLPAAAHAYKVKPLSSTLEPTGDGAKMTLTINNTHSYPLALELSVTVSEINPDGTEAESDADEQFMIFPPQAIVKPGKVQKVQVRYIGDAVDTSRIFRVHIEQLPITPEGDGMQVGFNYAFHPIIYVVPKNAAFDINVQSINPTADSYEVTVANSGNRHAVLATGEWIATDASGQTHNLEVDKLGISKTPLIGAGQTRTLTLPRAAFGDLGPITTLSITPER